MDNGGRAALVVGGASGMGNGMVRMLQELGALVHLRGAPANAGGVRRYD